MKFQVTISVLSGILRIFTDCVGLCGFDRIVRFRTRAHCQKAGSCERSISSLRNLKNYLRNTMTQDRLHRLALMHAHRDMDFDLDRIIDLFAEIHPRRMRMGNILI